MKRNVKCTNGNKVTRWYDRKSRSWVVQVIDTNGYQVGDADYSGCTESCEFAFNLFIKDNGGEST